MNAKKQRLSVKSRTILDLISKGHSYEQILLMDDAITYFDIFNTASEAVELDAMENDGYDQRMAKIRSKSPRAYEKWTEEEETQLINMFASDPDARWIAEKLQLQPSAIRSRLIKLGLLRT